MTRRVDEAALAMRHTSAMRALRPEPRLVERDRFERSSDGVGTRARPLPRALAAGVGGPALPTTRELQPKEVASE